MTWSVFNTLVSLWILGDVLVIPLLQNEALDHYRAALVWHWKFNSVAVTMAYEHTPSGSRLRRFIIDCIGKTWSNAPKPKAFFDFPKEALVELLQVVWKQRPEKWSREDLRLIDMCDYHVHEDGIRCSGAEKRKAQERGNDS